MAQYSVGTVSTVAGSNVVTGTGTQFLTNVVSGSEIFIDEDRAPMTVLSVDSDTQLTLTANYYATKNDVEYAVVNDFTDNLNLPILNQGDLYGAEIYSDALRKIDAAARFGLIYLGLIKDKDLSVPPGSPTTGDKYIVASGGSGAWAGLDGQVVEWIGSVWENTIPDDRNYVYVDDEDSLYIYLENEWRPWAVTFRASGVEADVLLPLNSPTDTVGLRYSTANAGIEARVAGSTITRVGASGLDVVAGGLRVGGTQVLSSARALQNITSLDVSGTANVGAAGTSSNARMQVAPGNTAAYPSLGTSGGGLTLGNNFGLDVGVRGNGNSWLQAHRFDGTPTAYGLILQPAGGNVGIGTQTPTEMLDVDGDTRVKSGTLQVGNTTNAAYNRIGTAASNRGLNAATQLFVEGNVEVDGTLYADGTSVLSGTVYLGGPSGSQNGGILHNTAPDDELVLYSETALTLMSSTRRVRVGPGAGSEMDFEGFCLGGGGLGLPPVYSGSVDVSSSNFAVLFVDAADGDLKIRFPNGTLKTIATN